MLLKKDKQIKHPQLDTEDIAEIDNANEFISIQLSKMKMPDCGNLRSTKRKEVLKRVNCLQALVES